MLPFIKPIKPYVQPGIENIFKNTLSRKVTNNRTELVYKVSPNFINWF